MSSMVNSIQDLRGLQVLLGLVMLFARVPDSQPSLMLIAAALQLSHRLRLHESSHEWEMNSGASMEGRCIFGITYILDKDVNVRSSISYLHQDHDTPLETPDTFDEPSAAGVIHDHTGQLSFSFLAAHLHLARIQGRTYDWTHSAPHRMKG